MRPHLIHDPTVLASKETVANTRTEQIAHVAILTGVITTAHHAAVRGLGFAAI